jgi:hypothetical protein
MTVARRPLRPISWWWVAFGIAAVGAAIWISIWWLLAQTHGLHGTDRATTRLDAIKAGLSIGAGTGGAVALLLAMRRQWLSERDQLHREQVADATQHHAERVASASEHDAAERRVTDLYVKAVEQLGSDQAVVRLGGLYALERLAQNNSDHQQTIANVLCAYLRMPYAPPGEIPESDDVEQRVAGRNARSARPRRKSSPGTFATRNTRIRGRPARLPPRTGQTSASTCQAHTWRTSS